MPGNPEDDELAGVFALLDSLDVAGEDVARGLDYKRLAQEEKLKDLAGSLWHEYQSRISISKEAFEAALDRDDLTLGDLFAPGVTEFVETASTQDELDHYKKKLQFRMELLELFLTETMEELSKAERWVPQAQEVDAQPQPEET